MTPRNRQSISSVIEEEALAWAIGEATPSEIDKLNILQASYLAMHRAIAQLEIVPQLLLIDGNSFNTYENIPHQCIVQGDRSFASIAAASVLAKTYRDRLMQNLAKDFPEYAWEKNAGYPTKVHRQAIQQHGVTPHHRKTFRLLPEPLDK